MSDRETLKSLETLLESFLERAVAAKGNRLSVLEGINRLDDIASQAETDDLAGTVGNWLADHSDWLAGQTLRPGDKRRIAELLADVQANTELTGHSAEAAKIQEELTRWSERLTKGGGGLVLRRGPEGPAQEKDEDPVQKFTAAFAGTQELFSYLAGTRPHLLSVLDEALKMAELQKKREALLLAGFLLYYLRIGGYKIDPYVKRLKAAEQAIAGEKRHA